MPETKIPDDVRQFVFEHIESIEQLEILLLLRAHPQKEWTFESISKEMRTSVSSVEKRIKVLHQDGFVSEKTSSPAIYSYTPKGEDTDRLIGRVEEALKTFRTSMYELIYSPLKRARNFSAAFTVKKDGGPTNG